jgi:hypothetical protein
MFVDSHPFRPVRVGVFEVPKPTGYETTGFSRLHGGGAGCVDQEPFRLCWRTRDHLACGTSCSWSSFAGLPQEWRHVCRTAHHAYRPPTSHRRTHRRKHVRPRRCDHEGCPSTEGRVLHRAASRRRRLGQSLIWLALLPFQWCASDGSSNACCARSEDTRGVTQFRIVAQESVRRASFSGDRIKMNRGRMTCPTDNGRKTVLHLIFLRSQFDSNPLAWASPPGDRRVGVHCPSPWPLAPHCSVSYSPRNAARSCGAIRNLYHP